MPKTKTTTRLKPVILNVGTTEGHKEPAATIGAIGTTQMFGDSMHPTFAPGSTIAYREVKDKTYFMLGEAYIIGTADYTMVRRVHSSEREGYIRLSADNTAKNGAGYRYEDFEIPTDKITFIGLIVGSATRVQM